jgi:hypothetical protein
MALPPVIAARKRGKLNPGENVIPWCQGFVAAAARAAYFFNCANNFNVSLVLGGYVAICCATYSGLIAVGVATGSQRDRLVMYMWFAVALATGIQWNGDVVVAGYIYVATNASMKISLMAGIPHAVRTRDGRLELFSLFV